MAFRLKLVPAKTNIDFFRVQWLTFGLSIFLMVASIVCVAVMGLNFGVDFKGGTVIMAATPEPHPVGDFRTLLSGLDVGEVGVTDASDTTGAGRNVVMMRIGVTGDNPDSQHAVIQKVQTALNAAFPGINATQS